MEFVAGDLVRMGFGFFNPNHAAAAICAAFPFCWGWRGKWRWAGWLVGVLLCVMLAMTYSRTGMAVLAIEAILLWGGRKILLSGMIGHVETSTRSTRSTWLKKMQGRGGLATSVAVAVAVAAIALWWMWPRLVLDGAVMNRPKIWLAGLKLFAANPLGVGFGESGEIATTFMLPEGVTVRTLVNSHLTLLAEMGAFVGGAWLAFIALALCVGRAMRRTWVAFAGLTVSAFSASVFDWHELFDFAEKGGYGAVNFVLAWGLFVAFVVMGAAMMAAWGRRCLTQRCGEAECAEGFWRMASAKAVLAVAGVAVALCAVVVGLWSDATPRVEGAYVVCGGRVGARVPTDGGPSVYRDEGWSLKSVAKRFPDGARFCIRPGVPEDVVDSGEVWLFGDAAEAAWRFPSARLTLVSPPEFFDPPTNAVVTKTVTRI
ncbi:MAG: hypothetical protein IJG18_00115 [Kiritimatiellae bacterium]|nr:hypothetical protein [Kiritimatiellia bacterium]